MTEKVRGRPWPKGRSGNPKGKPKGARHRVTVLCESLLDGEGEALTRKAIELAHNGDQTLLRSLLDRLLPIRRERSVQLKLPKLRSAADAARAMASITSAVAASEISLGEGAELVSIVEVFVRTLEASELERRLRKIEEWQARMKNPVQ